VPSLGARAHRFPDDATGTRAKSSISSDKKFHFHAVEKCAGAMRLAHSLAESARSRGTPHRIGALRRPVQAPRQAPETIFFCSAFLDSGFALSRAPE
jgi:hypothetical protein